MLYIQLMASCLDPCALGRRRAAVTASPPPVHPTSGHPAVAYPAAPTITTQCPNLASFLGTTVLPPLPDPQPPPPTYTAPLLTRGWKGQIANL